ncbi:hypothetical protein I3F58_16140 [Streptomyces sp. MUM 203J]|uniref:hypothetical protein n=1 Tax=Streptomyces sp. MUM 203J TaxID=2791990 RepID=UPI001F04289B|nr:hypothetical protein [Streptomyces sp. MUM 203J]MCH0541069.1 hypothetical protein [Streptomyces sp. MUM 203J]
MKIRHVGKLRRAGLAAVLAAALTVSLTACSSDDGAQPPTKVAAESPSDKKNEDKGEGGGADSGRDGGGTTLPDTSKVLATLKGSEQGIAMVIYSAVRDDGGFLTVSGEIKNDSGKRYTTQVSWSGDERAVARTGRSFAAMTLVDSKEKKRYYVLRDTENRPLTTTGLPLGINAGESLPFFAQFPAPPATTTKVDLQFPGFPNASLEIS